MPDQVLTRDGPVAVPLDYTVPQSGELLPLMVRATLDGSAATSPFYAVVQVIAPSGRVMGSAVSASIAAGGSADVTWFPGAEVEVEATTSAGVTVETLFLDMTVGTVTASTVFAAGVEYTYTVQGTYIYYDHSLDVGTPESAAMFPTSSAGRSSTQVGLDSEVVFARSSTASGPGIGHYSLFLTDLGSGPLHIEPNGGPYSTPQAGHFYTYTVTGQGAAPTFSFNDTVYSDNYGKLRIAIQTQQASGTPGGGGTGTGSLLPDPSPQPDGAWLRIVSGAAVWRATPQVAETDLSLSDVATANSSTTKHGLLRKLDNNAAHFLDGTGAWSTPAASSGVTSLDSLTGAVSLVAGSGTVITDNSPAAGNITIGVSGTASGAEIAYAQITAPVNVTSTTEATGTTLISPGAISFNGSPVVVQFYGVILSPNGTNCDIMVCLFEGATQITRLMELNISSSSGNNQGVWPVSPLYRFTPSNGSHTYTVTAFVNTTAGTPKVFAGSGGTGGFPPSFVRFTYA